MQTAGGYTRTKNSIRNSTVAILLQFISLLVGFFSRKIFLDYLGTEVLGLNSTAASLLGFLNIAERDQFFFRRVFGHRRQVVGKEIANLRTDVDQ